MKKPKFYSFSKIQNKREFENGEFIEDKVRRITENNEPISDGAPLIYTPKEDGVIAAYNIRTDRWEIAQDAMNTKYKAEIAKSKNAQKPSSSESEQKEGAAETLAS